MLFITQLTLNVKQFNIIKTISYFINYNQELNLYSYKKSSILTNATKTRVKILKRIHENIIKMQGKFATYINNKRKNAPLLKKRNKVYLLTKNLKKKDKNKKLNSIKIEAFYIKKNKKIENYELNLFKNVKIYSIFNIFLLKSIDPNTFIQETFHYEK